MNIHVIIFEDPGLNGFDIAVLAKCLSLIERNNRCGFPGDVVHLSAERLTLELSWNEVLLDGNLEPQLEGLVALALEKMVAASYLVQMAPDVYGPGAKLERFIVRWH